MRSFVFVALVAAAASVSLSARTPDALTQVASRSTFGKTVLAELQNKMVTGSPLTELQDILDEIRSRLKDANISDTRQHENHVRECDDYKAELDSRIIKSTNEIARLAGEIVKSQARIDALLIEIEQMEDKITKNEETIVAIKAEIARLKQQRADDHAEYLQTKNDTKVCDAAVREILAMDEIGKVQQSDRQTIGDSAERYNSDFYTHSATNPVAMLEKLAANVKSEKARDLILLATASAVALGNDDVSQLVALLKKLLEELVKYDNTLDVSEQDSINTFDKETQVQNDLLDAEEKDLANNQKKLAALQENLANERSHLASLKQQKAAEEQKKRNLEATLADTIKRCQELVDAWLQRTEDRAAELDTLAQIESILQAKLSDSTIGKIGVDGERHNQHLNDRIAHIKSE